MPRKASARRAAGQLDPSTGLAAVSESATLCRLFDFVPGVQFWIKDRQMRYGWVNRQFLLNYSLERCEQVVGRTDYDLSPKHLADQFRMDDELVLAGQSVLNRVELVGRFDHTASWSITNKIPLRNARGAITGTAGLTYPLSNQAPEPQGPSVALGRVIAHVRQHFADPLDNEGLAAVAGLSVRAFERAFLRHFRLTPRQYLMRVRVRMACYALVYSPQPLSTIALQHGFCDQSHFCREFRRQVGLTPRAYRRQYQADDGSRTRE